MGHAMQPQEGLISKASAHFLMDHARPLASLAFVGKILLECKCGTFLLAKINDAKGKHTKGEIMMLRDKLIADCKAGHPYFDLYAD